MYMREIGLITKNVEITVTVAKLMSSLLEADHRAVDVRIVTSYGLTYKRLVGLSMDPNYPGLRH